MRKVFFFFIIFFVYLDMIFDLCWNVDIETAKSIEMEVSETVVACISEMAFKFTGEIDSIFYSSCCFWWR